MIDWWDRFEAAIDADGRSYRAISQEAGLGENFVSQILKKGGSVPGPSAEAVRQICHVINVSLTYIYTGAHMTLEMEEILTLLSRLPLETQRHFVGLLRNLPQVAADNEVNDIDPAEKSRKK